jgi:hypothetical protein
MTEKTNKQQQYWHIKVPRNKFPFPKFHFGQQVRVYWEDEDGVPHYDIGEIIGMQYNTKHYPCPEWAYLIRLIESENSPRYIGSDDGFFDYESNLVADDTPLEVED